MFYQNSPRISNKKPRRCTVRVRRDPSGLAELAAKKKRAFAAVRGVLGMRLQQGLGIDQKP